MQQPSNRQPTWRRSTESAILHFINSVYASLQANMYAVGVFIGLSKAFHTTQ